MSPLKSIVLAGVFLPLSFAAFAQSAPSAGPMQPGWGRQAGDPVERHKAMCASRYDHRATTLTTLETKLNLTDTQRPAWTQWRQAELDGAAKVRDACLAFQPRPGVRPTIVERQAHVEQILSIKLQMVKDSQPALQALYQTLSSQQKAVIDGFHGPRHNHFPRHWQQNFR